MRDVREKILACIHDLLYDMSTTITIAVGDSGVAFQGAQCKEMYAVLTRIIKLRDHMVKKLDCLEERAVIESFIAICGSIQSPDVKEESHSWNNLLRKRPAHRVVEIEELLNMIV